MPIILKLMMLQFQGHQDCELLFLEPENEGFLIKEKKKMKD